MYDIKKQKISPTEVAIPKEMLSAFYEALKDYLGIDDSEFVKPKKREGTQNFCENSGSIDEWYVDLAKFNLNSDDMFWIGSFWREIQDRAISKNSSYKNLK